MDRGYHGLQWQDCRAYWFVDWELSLNHNLLRLHFSSMMYLLLPVFEIFILNIIEITRTTNEPWKCKGYRKPCTPWGRRWGCSLCDIYSFRCMEATCQSRFIHTDTYWALTLLSPGGSCSWFSFRNPASDKFGSGRKMKICFPPEIENKWGNFTISGRKFTENHYQ